MLDRATLKSFFFMTKIEAASAERRNSWTYTGVKSKSKTKSHPGSQADLQLEVEWKPCGLWGRKLFSPRLYVFLIEALHPQENLCEGLLSAFCSVSELLCPLQPLWSDPSEIWTTRFVFTESITHLTMSICMPLKMKRYFISSIFACVN